MRSCVISRLTRDRTARPSTLARSSARSLDRSSSQRSDQRVRCSLSVAKWPRGIIGFLARVLVPGPDPMGWLGTIVLGIVGSLVGGFLASLLFTGQAVIQPAGWIGSIVGAVIVLLIWRQMGRRVVA
ncbi:MAG: GlsB/YeaQ/YmgE family stress response membrane protein [Chloroflexi bacterium]|nr:MAG: GlsB/YeaQ/YmgE family stress response membrane protein [Chloroflexota bacterium]